jgi:hypothetical protein
VVFLAAGLAAENAPFPARLAVFLQWATTSVETCCDGCRWLLALAAAPSRPRHPGGNTGPLYRQHHECCTGSIILLTVLAQIFMPLLRLSSSVFRSLLFFLGRFLRRPPVQPAVAVRKVKRCFGFWAVFAWRDARF